VKRCILIAVITKVQKCNSEVKWVTAFSRQTLELAVFSSQHSLKFLDSFGVTLEEKY